jgi:AraC-like DNA-binding protein
MMSADPLSDVLRTVRLTGGVFLEASLTAPWSIIAAVSPEHCARFQIPTTSQIIAYHLIVSGTAFVSVEGQPSVAAHSGEVILLPQNDVHVVASSPNVPPVTAANLILPTSQTELSRLEFGGGGEATSLYCGFLAGTAQFSPIIAALPKVLKLDMKAFGAFDWIESSMRFAMQELLQGRLAASNTMSRLSELLLVEAVHHFFDSVDQDPNGWLGGFRDPQVGRALAALHGSLQDAWTAELLAEKAGMSRTAFIDRFTSLTGLPPIKYLTKWRLLSARLQLQETALSIARVAHAVGYESEEGFSRAFKREFGKSPAHWRSGYRDRN